MRGKRLGTLVMVEPAGSAPQVATSAMRWSANGPRAGSAPSEDHSVAVAFGITGLRSTASALNPSAAVTRIVANRPPSAAASGPPSSGTALASFHGACSVR